MGNLASISKIQETFKNWKISRTTWARIANKVRDLMKSKMDQTKKKNIPAPDKNDYSSTPIFLPSQNVKMDQSVPIFPPGVVTEILSRLPLKTLTQLQLVCRDWQALILDHYVTEKHLDRSDFMYHWHNSVVPNHNGQNKPSFFYMYGCNGLLLMRDNSDRKHFVWNPAIRRILELPDPHDHSHGFALSFVRSTKSYRIVSFYKHEESGIGVGCEVFTPGQSDVWKPLKVPKITNSSNRDLKRDRVSVFSSGGAVHCVSITKVDRETNIDIVSLELENENFTINHFPKLSQFVGWENYWDLDWDGKLAIADIVRQNMEVMVLEDYKKKRWCEKKRVIHLSFLKKDDGNVVYPLFVREGDIWFWLKDKEIFTYSIASGKCTLVRQAPNLSLLGKLYPYKPSLVSFQGMVSDTKIEIYRPLLKLS